LGALDLTERRYDSAIAHADRALEISPNNGYRIAVSGWIKSWAGQPGEAEAILKRGMRLDPITQPWMPLMLAVNQAMLGRHGEAKELYEGVLSSHAGHPLVALSAPPGLAVISVIEGDLDGARKRIDDWSQNNPMANIAALRNQFSDTLKDQAFAKRYLDALRHAGLPENPPLPLPDKPSIAVLPFTNMSDDPEQEWFADGMTDDLITDLSNISGLFVIARNTAFTYKDKAVDVKAVGRDWVLGTSSKAACGAPANTIRINAQLIDTQTGGHVWAEKYDRELKDVFAVQTEVARQVVKVLAVTLKANENERLFQKYTTNIDAYDVFLQARRTVDAPSKSNILRGEKLFSRVIELDPNFAGGYAGLSFNLSVQGACNLVSHHRPTCRVHSIWPRKRSS